MPLLARKPNESPQDSFVVPPIAVFLSVPPSEIRIEIYTIFKKQGSENYRKEPSLSKENFVLLPALLLAPTYPQIRIICKL
jgi:hypothetical protein